VNDASSLVALEFAAGLVVSGETPGFLPGLLHLLYLLCGGLAVGMVSAWIIHRVQVRLTDPPIEITVSLMAPYISYLLAEGVHASGPLATVVCGLYLGRKSAEVFSTQARLENTAVWNTLDFLLNGIVFILIGLQLPFIMGDIRSLSRRELLLDAAIFTAVVIALRLLWVFPGAAIGYWIRVHVLKQHEARPKPRAIFILGWTGMRGVLALAAASSLPRTLSNGAPFPERNVIIFLTFAVILVTLVLQGMTLPLLIRKLGLSEGDAAELEEREARRQMLGAAMDYLQSIRKTGDESTGAAWLEVMQHYKQRYALVNDARSAEHDPTPEQFLRVRELSQRVRERERGALLALRNENKVNDHILRDLERELDLLDMRFGQRS
jgi:NhaP-type Na+/H+ or K+/H+ antiporter